MSLNPPPSEVSPASEGAAHSPRAPDPRLRVLAAMSLWMFGPLLQKLISLRSQYLLLVATLLLGLVTFLVIQVALEGPAFLRRLRAIRPSYPLFGLLGYFLYMVGMNRCFRLFGSAAGSTMLNYTWPVFTVLFAELIFRRSRKAWGVRLVEGAGLALGFLAVWLLATGGDPLSFRVSNVEGLFWGLLAGASYGLFSAYSGTVPAQDHGVFLVSAIGGSLLLMSPLGLAEWKLLPTLGWPDLLAAAGQGVLMNGLGYFFWTSANRLAREQGLEAAAVTSPRGRASGVPQPRTACSTSVAMISRSAPT